MVDNSHNPDVQESVDQKDIVESALFKLKFDIQRSCIYHQHRSAYFELLHRVTMGGVILLTSTAISAFIQDQYIKYIIFLATFITVLDFIIGYSKKSQEHRALYQRFAELQIDIVQADHPTGHQLAKWTARRLTIEKDEPPKFRVLDVACHNELVRAQYGDNWYELAYRIPFIKYQLRHVLRFQGAAFRRIQTDSSM